MATNKTIIAVDALGADKAPSVVLDGIKSALKSDSLLHIKVCGPEEIVVPFCNENSKCEPIISNEVISMDEHPANAVRKKKNSSIVLGCKCVKEKKAHGFYSAGNTGACLASSILYTGRISGIKRPMLAVNLPTQKNNVKTLFCDIGANADCKQEYLLQFAKMGIAYKKQIENINNPKVALLNIGEEESKGNKFSQETYKLLNDNVENFCGNAEGRDILSGNFDIIVTDGFTGNIVLKNIEGTFKTSFKLIKNVMLKSFKTKIAALLLKKDIKLMIEDLDPESIGAAFLFGIKGACCIGHGNSSSKAISNGILTTAKFARNNLAAAIDKEINKI